MSITPVDKPPDGDDAPDGALSRRSSVLRDYVGRFFSWLGERLYGASTRSGSQGRSESTGTPVSRDEDGAEATRVKSAECPSFNNFPEREKPLAHPARNTAGINTPDVVSIETEQGLRLSVPENPDAEMTSDVWMTVEP